ncbi:hypothetical protein KKF91_09515 [Myxococcota bacterium]|nr:hypothetical protein [Myxococcota bacterium]MBU1430779.1 hypothetical protein [Myxococcota bacterium]MBU1900008.1 hypothetical protein [Myxococcota bacterium]
MYPKSPTCVGQVSKRHLNEYRSLEEAQRHAAYLAEQGRGKMQPYVCERCGHWHLSPANRATPSKACPVCKGADGAPKDAYEREQDAARRARLSHKERGVSLTVYPCPAGYGWHLTRARATPSRATR